VPIARLLLISTIIASLRVGPILIVGATIAAVVPDASYGESHELGSVEDYLEDDPDFTAAYKVSSIGIEVSNGRNELKNGVRFAGIEIHQVVPGGPGAAAGLQGRRATALVAQAALIVGGLFLPPAATLAAIVMQRGGIGQSHDFIIAVDAQRTRNVCELENALGQAEPGQTVYLTIVTEGRREQVRLNLPREMLSRRVHVGPDVHCGFSKPRG
jgi:S1-C subfamily serine protease